MPSDTLGLTVTEHYSRPCETVREEALRAARTDVRCSLGTGLFHPTDRANTLATHNMSAKKASTKR